MLRGGVADDFVVDIGNVHHMIEGETTEAKPPPEKVDESERTKIANVCVIVNRGSAGVHADNVSPFGMKLFDLLR